MKKHLQKNLVNKNIYPKLFKKKKLREKLLGNYKLFGMGKNETLFDYQLVKD